MPTYLVLPRFWADFARLSPDGQRAFLRAREAFVADLRAGTGFRPGLRVKGVRGHDGVFEMTWAPDGRATFAYGKSVRQGQPHIIWRRVGTHAILAQP